MNLKQVLKRNTFLLLALNLVMLPSCKPKNQNSKAKTVEQDSTIKGYTRVIFAAKGFRTIRRATPDGNGHIAKINWVERGTEGETPITAVFPDENTIKFTDTGQIDQFQQYTGSDGKVRNYFLEGSTAIFVVGCLLPNGTKTIKVPKGPLDHPLHSQQLEIPISKVQWLWELVDYNTTRAKLETFNPFTTDLLKPRGYDKNMLANKTKNNCAILAGPRDKENVVLEFRGLAQLKSDLIASNVDMIFGDNLYKTQKYVPFAVDAGRTILSMVGGIMFFMSGGTLGPAIGMANMALQGGNKTLDVSKNLFDLNDQLRNAHNKMDNNTRKAVWITSETIVMQALEVAVYQIQTSSEYAMEGTLAAQLSLTPREKTLLRTPLLDEVRPENMQEYEALRKKLRDHMALRTNDVLSSFSSNFVKTFNAMKLDLAGIKALFPKSDTSDAFYMRIDTAWKKADIFRLFVMMEHKTDFTGTQFYNFATTKLGDGYKKYAAEKILQKDIQDPRDPNSKFAQAIHQSVIDAQTSPRQISPEMAFVAKILAECSGSRKPAECFGLPPGSTQDHARNLRHEKIKFLTAFHQKEEGPAARQEIVKVIDQVNAQFERLPVTR